MELFGFVCTVGARLIFQQWLRGSISGYNDSGHLRIKHNTALSIRTRADTTTFINAVNWFYLCSVNTNKQKPHSETDFCAWQEATCAGSCISPGRRPWPHSSECQLPSFPTELRRAKCCRLHKSLPTINASVQHSLQEKHFPTSPWQIFKC